MKVVGGQNPLGQGGGTSGNHILDGLGNLAVELRNKPFRLEDCYLFLGFLEGGLSKDAFDNQLLTIDVTPPLAIRLESVA